MGAAAWSGALIGLASARADLLGLPLPWILLLLGALGTVAVALRMARTPTTTEETGPRAHPGTGPATWLCVLLMLAGLSGLRSHSETDGLVADLAQRRSSVTLVGRVVSDPRLRPGAFGDAVILRLSVRRLESPVAATTRAPVLVMSGGAGEDLRWGSTVRWQGRLGPASGPDLAAVLVTDASPHQLARPGVVHRAAESVRQSIRESAGGPSPGDGLVPALVDGDDATLPDGLVDDFRRAGLTHLTAVSGANLTILLAFLLPLARWCRVRGRALLAVGVLGVAGFVLVARPEPSVLRAAVMGTVALVGLSLGSRRAGLRALGAALLGLLLIDPALARAWGFALSVAATAGILLLAPAISQGLSRHLPSPVAEAVAIPVAAQLACTPLVAALSDEVSVVAVAANLLAAPLVGPTTVLGLTAGLLGLVAAPLALLPGVMAGTCAQGIVLIAQRSAALPGAAIAWTGSGWPLIALGLLCAVTAVAAPWLARQRWMVVALAIGLLLVVLRPGPWGGDWPWRPGWPPDDWAVAMCDVGQGDAVALRTGPSAAVVVDAGARPEVVDRCLSRLGVDAVDAVVLTHFHQDHVAGLAGVLEGREVAEIQVSPIATPASGAAEVQQVADAAGVPVRIPAVGETAHSGDMAWQVVGPLTPGAESPNDASLVLLARVGDLTVLLTGDAEPPAQAALARAWDLGPVDVLKVPHHGSRYQDETWLRSLRASVALVSVGRDNDYGHPAPETVSALEAQGVSVWRTDTGGDLAVVAGPGGPAVSTSR